MERTSEFLGRFGLPIEVVSFEVFELDGGPQLLIREVVDEPARLPRPGHRLTVDAIRARAVDLGVSEQFDRFVEMSERAGLPVQPQRSSVRIAPPSDRRRFLMYASPETGASGGGQATAALGRYDEGGHLGGEQLDNRLDQIERFLNAHLPPEDD